MFSTSRSTSVAESAETGLDKDELQTAVGAAAAEHVVTAASSGGSGTLQRGGAPAE